MRSSSETDADGRAVDARQPPPRTSRGMQAAVAAFMALALMLLLLLVLYDGIAGFEEADGVSVK